MDNNDMVYMPGIVLVREDFETALEFRRQDKRYTRRKLSELSGVSVRMIEQYEQGLRELNKAQAITVYKLAEALGCRVEDLLDNVDTKINY